MTIGIARAVKKRSAEADLYGLAEREQQYQYELVGSVGVLPTEVALTLNFGIQFVADSGNQRDSSLDRPHLRTGFEEDFAPPGTIPYAKVTSWLQDVDLNFVGAKVLVGVHCPAAAFEGTEVNQSRFRMAVHLSFQGYGWVQDADGALDAGGNIDLGGGTT